VPPLAAPSHLLNQHALSDARGAGNPSFGHHTHGSLRSAREGAEVYFTFHAPHRANRPHMNLKTDRVTRMLNESCQGKHPIIT